MSGATLELLFALPNGGAAVMRDELAQTYVMKWRDEHGATNLRYSLDGVTWTEKQQPVSRYIDEGETELNYGDLARIYGLR